MRPVDDANSIRPEGNAFLRRLQPSCRPPVGGALRQLSAREVQRLRMRLAEPLEYIHSPLFTRRGAAARFARTKPTSARPAPHSLGGRLRSGASKSRSLSRGQEVELFLRYNYCRYRLTRILKAYAGKPLTAAAARELLGWDQAMLAVRDEIVQANLGLVPSMVERSRLTGVDFAELISEGQLALLRSVDKFDCSRGFKFSTYACRAILTSISRAVALMARQRARFPTEYDPDLQRSDFLEARREELRGICVDELTNILADNAADLTPTERRVLSERFGMKSRSRKDSADPKTLRQVAEVFGVTKERIRQIQNKALAKLREVLDEQVFAT